MAKKRSDALPGMEDEFEVPEEVQDTADTYAKHLTAKNKASAKFNSAKANLDDAMRDNQLDRVRVLLPGGNVRIIERTEIGKLLLKKPQKVSDDEG